MPCDGNASNSGKKQTYPHVPVQADHFMRILLTLHHAIDANRGAAGATTRLAEALRRCGHHVDLYSFDDAFKGAATSVLVSAQFPTRFALHVAKAAAGYDIIDASSGDAWLWASLGRPGSNSNQALIFRSHGLEHTADRQLRAEAKDRRRRLRKRYYVYHGGIRLWEVAQSLRLADAAVLLNASDRRFAIDELRAEECKVAVIPNGLPDTFFEPIPYRDGSNLEIAFIGTWSERKGVDVLPPMLELLHRRNIEVRLKTLGTGLATDAVLSHFPQHLHTRIANVPAYRNDELIELLHQSSILVLPSRSEGFSLALIEAMARGLVPLTTAAGAAGEVIDHGTNGFILPMGQPERFVEAVARLHVLPTELYAMQCAARSAVLQYRWDDIARRTVSVYTAALEERRRARQPAAAS